MGKCISAVKKRFKYKNKKLGLCIISWKKKEKELLIYSLVKQKKIIGNAFSHLKIKHIIKNIHIAFLNNKKRKKERKK